MLRWPDLQEEFVLNVELLGKASSRGKSSTLRPRQNTPPAADSAVSFRNLPSSGRGGSRPAGKLITSSPTRGTDASKGGELPMTSDHEAHPGVCGRGAKMECTGTITPAAPASDNNWRWARRIEANERVAKAALQKEEAAAIEALDRDR